MVPKLRLWVDQSLKWVRLCSENTLAVNEFCLNFLRRLSLENTEQFVRKLFKKLNLGVSAIYVKACDSPAFHSSFKKKSLLLRRWGALCLS